MSRRGAGSCCGHALSRETRGARAKGRGAGIGPREQGTDPGGGADHSRLGVTQLQGATPPASAQRVNAPAGTAGPGCESRGVAPEGSAAGAPRLPLPCRGRSAPSAGASFSNLRATGGACGPRESPAPASGRWERRLLPAIRAQGRAKHGRAAAPMGSGLRGGP